MAWAMALAVTILVWLIEGTVWFALVALIVRPFGIRLPIWWWHRPESAAAAVRALNRWQYVLVEGVLKYGVGSWLFFSTANYIDYRFEYRYVFGEMTIGLFFFSLAATIVMGMLVGLADWARGHRQRVN
jgi:hypothetical protein